MLVPVLVVVEVSDQGTADSSDTPGANRSTQAPLHAAYQATNQVDSI